MCAIVQGQVQGVGFRPFVFRLASILRLTGIVRNTSVGVDIHVEGDEENLGRFCESIIRDIPPSAHIDSVVWQGTEPRGYLQFSIEPSADTGLAVARVPRDLATCASCHAEILDLANRRHRYPFTNCTACGPRYSILRAMPYDRQVTSMQPFVMCPRCAKEYESPGDRRFHAEPNACDICGPSVELLDFAGRSIAKLDYAIEKAAELLRAGQIIAIKGLGGFQLVAAADDADAIERLRVRKRRPRKPFAVMVADLEQAERHVDLDDIERQLLVSPTNPIVVAKRRGNCCADIIAPGLNSIGLLLPTTPLHHLLLRQFSRPIVATSGNRSSEPIYIGEADALASLSDVADAFLVHNRPIVRRLDDSVAHVANREIVVTRLGRGYAPLPLLAIEAMARRAALPPMIAVGGHLKSALAVWTGTQAVLGPHIGDLDSPQARIVFEQSVRDICNLYRFEPAIIVCDRHPEYFTAQWARKQGLPVIDVQHHHAHAAACMVEHGLLDRKTLAITWDGTGLGLDDTIWGGEVLRIRDGESERIASLLPFSLPGGEAAIRHPNRIAFSMIRQVIGQRLPIGDRWLKRLRIDCSEAALLDTMAARHVRSPLTSSVGRLFDALAALVLPIHEATYEGEAAVLLEAITEESNVEGYPLPLIRDHDGLPRGDWRPMLRAILHDLEQEVARGPIAARIHNALAQWVVVAVHRESIKDVVLSGGCFQNRILLQRVGAELIRNDYRVYSHRLIPPGDGGLAAGQLAIAAMQLTARKE
jgi:hydrogenase maturation protein HypF